jgi:hypothetical protein
MDPPWTLLYAALLACLLSACASPASIIVACCLLRGRRSKTSGAERRLAVLLALRVHTAAVQFGHRQQEARMGGNLIEKGVVRCNDFKKSQHKSTKRTQRGKSLLVFCQNKQVESSPRLK